MASWFKNSFMEHNTSSPAATGTQSTRRKRSLEWNQDPVKTAKRSNAIAIQANSKPSRKTACVSDLLESCAPRSVAELDMHPGKIKEIRLWLEHCRGLLFLSGPSGTGKSTCVRTLCADMGVPLREWDTCEEIDVTADGSTVSEVTEMESFKRFLAQHDRRGVSMTKYLPYECYTENILPSLLEKLSKSGNAIIFCLSTVPSCWNMNPVRLFPSALCQRLGIDAITTNSFAPTYIAKALRRIVKKANIIAKESDLSAIGRTSDGDLRRAITSIQCLACGNKLASFHQADTLLTVCLAARVKQISLFRLFHLLGRILYAKRVPSSTKCWSDAESRLNDYGRRRPEPERDINMIVADPPCRPSEIVLYLSEHCPRFSPDIPSLSRTMADLSFADSKLSNWQHRIVFDEYSLQIAARSCAFNNYSDAKRASTKYEFRKAPWKDLAVEIASLEKNAGKPSSRTEHFTLMIPMRSKISCNPDDAYISRPMDVSWQIGQKMWESSSRIKTPAVPPAVSQPEESFKIEDTDESDFNDSF